MIKAVVFDLDGTLLNTLEDLADSCNYTLNQLNYKTYETEKYKEFIGSGRYKLIERMLPKEVSNNKEIITRALEIFDKHYSKNMRNKSKPYKGVLKLLESLKSKDILLAVVSNKPHKFTIETVENYFENSFALVLGQREGYAVKPDPASLLEVIEKLEVNKEEVLYIGDSEVDIYTAKNAEVTSVAVVWGFRGLGTLEEANPDYIVKNTEEILQIIEEL